MRKSNYTPLYKLKGLRAENAMTQEDIATILGVTKATYNRKENGMVAFDTYEINKLLIAFKIKYEDLFLVR